MQGGVMHGLMKRIQVSSPAANIPSTDFFDFDRRWQCFLQYIFAFYPVDPVNLDIAKD
jgi:hypothetical protein